jgi:polyhydroxybutyrate depolymerase
MKIRSALRIMLLAAGIACALSAPAARAQDREEVVKVNGSPRTIQVHLPSEYSKAKRYPVVLVLHGMGENGFLIARLSHFNKTADQYGFIVVYPNSREGRWTYAPDEGVRIIGGWGRNRTIMDEMVRQPRPDDVGGRPLNEISFFGEVLDQIESEYSVDASRIYATGYSEGGFMGFRLGCELSGRIAAIATVGAVMPESLAETCSTWSWRAVPLLMMNGTDDTQVPYGGRPDTHAGLHLLPARETLREWAKINSCLQKPQHETIPPRTKGGLQTRVETYSDCDDGATAVLYSIEKGGHTWPGGGNFIPERFVGKTNDDLDASEIIWKFFAAHPMRVKR